MPLRWPDHSTPLEETKRTLERLTADGKIRHHDAWNLTAEMMRECNRRGQIAANQVGYHLFERRMEAAVLASCRGHEIDYMPCGSLGFGLPSGGFTPETTFVDRDWRSGADAFGLPLFEREHFHKELRVAEWRKAPAARHEKPLPQLAVAWVLGDRTVPVALVGMRDEREMRDNIAAAGWRLTEEDHAAIDAVFAGEGVPAYAGTPQAV